MSSKEKIKTKADIEKIVKEIKENNPNKIIVTTNGAFDIIHSGHIFSLEKAKSFGDYLIVGLNSDESIKRYKSKNRPILGQKDRAIMLASLEAVNFVVIFDEDDPRDLLSYIKPNIHVKSKSGYKGIEKEVIENNGGKIVLLEDIEGISTTEIINRIKKLIQLNEL